MSKPIIVMDSGIGGLSVLRKLCENFPNERYIYLSDLKNMPYGNKSSEEVKKFALKNLKRSLKRNPKFIVVACNTMSVTAREIFQTHSPVPVFFIKPDLNKLRDLGESNCLLICTCLTALNPEIKSLKNSPYNCVMQLSDLAEKIEKSNNLSEIFLNYSLKNLLKQKKYIFLGCTHYIEMREVFKSINNDLIFFDGSENLLAQISCFCTQEKKLKKTKVKFIGSGKKHVKNTFYKNRIGN